MRNRNTNVKCIRVSSKKSDKVCRCYSDIQLKYLELIEENDKIVKVELNVKLSIPSIKESYSTDFLLTLDDGKVRIRECVYKKQLLRPTVVKLLDLSRNYWLSKGYSDWGIVINESE